MAEQQQWFVGKPEENFGLGLASDTEAYGGHTGRARELTRRAVDSAVRSDSKETGAIWQAIAAQREAIYGYPAEARKMAADALLLAPTSQGAEAEVALAFALAGDTARAESLAQDLAKRYPLDSQIQALWLPPIRGQVALNKKNPAAALAALQPVSPIELGQISFVANISCLYPTLCAGRCFWPPTTASPPPPNSRKFSTTPASSGTAGPARWRDWEWPARTRCKRKRCREPMPMPPAFALSLLIKISSRYGKTPTPTSPSSNKLNPNSPGSSNNH